MAGLNQVFEFLAALKNITWGNVKTENLQRWIDDPIRLAEEMQKLFRTSPNGGVVEKSVDPVLRRLFNDETITIAPCDGSKFISDAKNTFKSFIDSDLERWGLNNCGKSTVASNVTVHEMIEDATFVQIFGSIGSDLDKMCLSQHQIISFCVEHCDRLRQSGYATFFLFKEGDQFYVAYVRVNSGGLYVYVSRLGYGYVWSAVYAGRVVVPQLTV